MNGNSRDNRLENLRFMSKLP
ncbi:MAG: hypothetical protein M1514_02875 [Patescibacteria group bacterium]|nr:hypothetical protein [Patescibacteria group bacterium]